MYFEIENSYYELHRDEWLVDHEGTYVVIREREVLGFYTDYDEAVSAGYVKYGVGETAPFMVKAVRKEDTPIMMLKIGGRRCHV